MFVLLGTRVGANNSAFVMHASLCDDAPAARALLKTFVGENQTGMRWYVFDLATLRGKAYMLPAVDQLPDPAEVAP